LQNTDPILEFDLNKPERWNNGKLGWKFCILQPIIYY